MKKSRPFVGATLALTLCFGLLASYPQKAAADQQALSYILKVTAASGAFASREVMTLHPDHSIFVIDSGQDAARQSFSSEQGVWKCIGKQFVAHSFDFNFAPSSEFARADYAFTLGAGGRVNGSITLQVFPITGNPLGSGTVIGTFSFTGFAVPN